MSRLKMAAVAAALIVAGAGSALAKSHQESASQALALQVVDASEANTTGADLGNAGFLTAGTEKGTKNDTFADAYSFTLSSFQSSVDFFATATTLNNKHGVPIGPEVTFSGWSLVDVTTGKSVGGASGLAVDSLEFDDLLLAKGDYRLVVDGTFQRAPDLYTGFVTATAVPEPAEAALLLAGLGLVGAVARRRVRRAQA